MELSRPEYWSGKPFPALGDLHKPEIEPGPSALQVDSLSTELSRNPVIEQASKSDYNEGFPGFSDSKQSNRGPGDPRSTPGSGRAPGVEMATHFGILL